MEHIPYLAFLPYLPLERPVVFSNWWLGPAARFRRPWASPEFHTASRRFLTRFRTADGRRVTSPAILAHRERGADGRLPSAHEVEILEATILFAVLDANPEWSEEVDARRVATSDNADLFLWPIDVGGGVTMGPHGLIVQHITGGLRFTRRGFRVPGPLALSLPRKLTLDADLMGALVGAMSMAGPRQPESDAARMLRAIRWYGKAWRNDLKLDWGERVVMLKTAFETLLNEDDTRMAARKIERLFCRVLGTRDTDLLWKPKERRRVVTYTKLSGNTAHEARTDLMDWCITFGEARNTVVHKGLSPEMMYACPGGSAYDGHLFHTGSRLFREAVKVRLEDVGFPMMWASARVRHGVRLFTRIRQRLARSRRGGCSTRTSEAVTVRTPRP
ncbi:MAG: hypothetical protein L6R43_00145 [Planctomycetes bacterium]|nr:hypothetical protein [Planctomycetota bacterium]